MSLTRSMETLHVDKSDPTSNKISNFKPDNQDVNWESWKKLKLSSFHGKKLIKKAYRPYHPKTKAFYLHELDSFGFEPGEKITMLMRTLKKVLGNPSSPNTNKSRRINAKLSFVRVKGLKHFQEGKSVKDLVDFPDSYWTAYKTIMDAKQKKTDVTSSVELKN